MTQNHRRKSADDVAEESSSSESAKATKDCKNKSKKQRQAKGKRSSSSCSSCSGSSKSSGPQEKGEGDKQEDATGDKTGTENAGDDEEGWPFCKLNFEEVGMWNENLCQVDLKEDRVPKSVTCWKMAVIRAVAMVHVTVFCYGLSLGILSFNCNSISWLYWLLILDQCTIVLPSLFQPSGYFGRLQKVWEFCY